MSNTTAQEAIQRITEARPVTDERDCRGMSVGEWARQGDVYVERLADNSKPIGKRTTNRQAAPGNTQGSRHMIEGDVVVRETSGDPLRGPVVVAKGDWWLRHPEHAHMQFGAGVYQVRFQRDFAREERAAVQD